MVRLPPQLLLSHQIILCVVPNATTTASEIALIGLLSFQHDEKVAFAGCFKSSTVVHPPIVRFFPARVPSGRMSTASLLEGFVDFQSTLFFNLSLAFGQNHLINLASFYTCFLFVCLFLFLFSSFLSFFLYREITFPRGFLS